MKNANDKNHAKTLKDIFQIHKNSRVKTELLDSSYRSIWSDLFAGLSHEEINALYYALKETTFSPHDTLFKQGQKDSHLYFINQGELKLVYHQGKKEILLEYLGPGSLAGHETFFSKALYHTASLVALSPVQVSILEPEFLPTWRKRYPKLLAALKSYASKQGNLEELLKTTNMDRRTYTRFKVEGTATIQLLNPPHAPIKKTFKTKMLNVSMGGLCFGLTLTQAEMAQHLLGLKMNIQLELSIDKKENRMEKTGIIVGVHPAVDQYTIHTKFVRA